MRVRPLSGGRTTSTRSADVLRIIRDELPPHLRGAGYAALTVHWYCRHLRRAEEALAKRGQSLLSLASDRAPDLARRLTSGAEQPWSFATCRAALHAWMRYRGQTPQSGRSEPPASWEGWIDAYDAFLKSDRGLSAATRLYRRRYARCFLKAMFQSGRPRWRKLRPAAIWRFSEAFSGGLTAGSANVMLFSLKSFLRFLHLKAVCPEDLVHAVPHFANYGHATKTQVLTEQQRLQLLAAFDAGEKRDLRDQAIAHCLLELGLRAQEVALLKTSDIDWERGAISVPAVKAGRGRKLPLPPHVAKTLRSYLDRGRINSSTSDHLFLRHRSFAGQAFTLRGLRQMIRRVYRRCGFPSHWAGTHRLRHTFATRLYHRGADPKQIADLLGHSDLASTDTYLHSDLVALQALARPWPSSHA